MDNDITSDDLYTAPLSLDQLKRKVSQFVNSTDETGKIARKCRDYYDGDQISPAVKAELIERGQKPIKINGIAQIVQSLFGLIDGTQTSPEALPRNATDQDAADTITKLLRFITTKNKFARVRKQVSENFVIQGVGACVYGWDDKRSAVTADRIRWEEFVYDPMSAELDFSDARFLGVAKMMDEDTVMAQFPKFPGMGTGSGELDTFSMFDDDQNTWWAQPQRKRMRVVDLYFVGPKGDWHRAIFCNTDILWAGPSDYHDDIGESICPIKAVTYEIRRSGLRYGPIWNMLDVQDEVNQRRSRLLNILSHRQTRQTQWNAPPVNKEIARKEAAKPDGTIPYGWETVTTADMASGQMQVYTESKADLAAMAPHPATMARNATGDQSGRALQVLSQSGNQELARPFDWFNDWEQAGYETMWYIAREYMTAPQMVRVTDDPRSPGFLQINQPVMGPKTGPVIHPQTGEAIVNPITGLPHMVTTHGQIGTKNKIADLDLDIIMSSTANTATLQQEVFTQVMEYASALKISPFDPQFKAIIEMSPIADKRDIIEAAERLSAEQQQANAPAQAQQQAMEAQQHQVDMAIKSGKALKEQAQSQLAVTQSEEIAQRVKMVEGSLWHQAGHPPVIPPSFTTPGAPTPPQMAPMPSVAPPAPSMPSPGQ